MKLTYEVSCKNQLNTSIVHAPTITDGFYMYAGKVFLCNYIYRNTQTVDVKRGKVKADGPDIENIHLAPPDSCASSVNFAPDDSSLYSNTTNKD